MYFFTGSAMAQHTFTVNGQLSPAIDGKKVILTYKINGTTVDDTTMVKAGRFTFRGTINDPSYGKLTLDPPAMLTMENIKTIDSRDFFIDAGKVEVKSNAGLKSSVVKGGPTQVDFQKRLDLFKPIQARVDSLSDMIEMYKANEDAEGMDEMRKLMTPEFAKIARIDSNIIKDNPSSYLALDLWRSKHRGTLRSSFEPEFQRFSQTLRNTIAGKEIQAKFDLARALAPGQPAPDFKLLDTAGKELSLSSLKGKNVFVCFYTPDFLNYDAFAFNLGRINRTLKDKNFEMVTVYYEFTDKSIGYWKENISKSKFNWLNVNDIGGIDRKGPVSLTAKSYGLSFNTMPAGFLIGTDGKILASQVRLSDTGLAQELENLIK